jgi:hypothetical protein
VAEHGAGRAFAATRTIGMTTGIFEGLCTPWNRIGDRRLPRTAPRCDVRASTARPMEQKRMAVALSDCSARAR